MPFLTSTNSRIIIVLAIARTIKYLEFVSVKKARKALKARKAQNQFSKLSELSEFWICPTTEVQNSEIGRLHSRMTESIRHGKSIRCVVTVIVFQCSQSALLLK